MEDPFFNTVDRFVEHESHDRHPVDVPIDLLDWKPPPGSPVKGDVDTDTPDDKGKRREAMIDETWRRYQQLLEKSGYPALRTLKKRLTRLEGRQGQILSDHKHRWEALNEILVSMRDWFSGWDGQTSMFEIIESDDFVQENLPSPYKLNWSTAGGRPPTAGSSRTPRSSGELFLGDEFYQLKPVVHLNRPKFQFRGYEVLDGIIRTLKGHVRREKREIESTDKLVRLIKFRKELLERFIWAYEIAGDVADATPDGIPTVVRRGERSHRHVLRILEVLPSLHENGNPTGGEWPTRDELMAQVGDWLNDRHCSQNPQALVEGALRLVRELAEDYENLRPDFYEYLIQHEDRFLDWADKLNRNISPGNDPSPEDT